MKIIHSTAVGILIIMMATSAMAFEVGENRLENSGFESGEVGVPPQKWELRIVG